MSNRAFIIWDTKKIARIRQQDYLRGEWQNLYAKNDLPIDAIISPEQEVAKAFHRRIISPGTIDMVELSEKQLKLIGFKCDNNCDHIGLTVRELSAKISRLPCQYIIYF